MEKVMSYRKVERNIFDERFRVLTTYKKIIETELKYAFYDNRRVSIIRFDLHIPKLCRGQDNPLTQSTGLMKKFFGSLVSKLKVSYLIDDVYRTQCLRYAWVKEFGENSEVEHYHICLFMDQDKFGFIGDSEYTSRLRKNKKVKKKSLKTCIFEAWASVFGLSANLILSSVHFTKKPVHWISSRDYEEGNEVYKIAVKRLMYLAKPETKCWRGDGLKSIGTGCMTIKKSIRPRTVSIKD
jgi:hypothetical protein